MKRRFTSLLIVVALLGCNFEINFGDTDGQVLTDPGPEEERVAAFAFADEVLDSLDQGEDIYPRVAPYLRESVPKPLFDSTISGLRGWVGPLKSRTARGYGYTNELDDAPPGNYFVIEYDSEFESGEATEKVVVSFDETGYFVAGYFLNRTWSTGGE